METQDISKNLGNGDILIYQSEDGELDENVVVRKFRTTQLVGNSDRFKTKS